MLFLLVFVAVAVIAIVLYQKYVKKGVLIRQDATEVYFENIIIVGKLINIENNKIAIESIDDMSLDEKADLVTYEVLIDENVKIHRYLDRIKSKEDFAREQLTYEIKINEHKKNNISTFGIEAPSWRISETILFSDLHINDRISVIATRDRNNFIAKIITLGNSEVEKTDLSGQIKEEYEGTIQMINKEKQIVIFNFFNETKEIKYNQDSEFYFKNKKNENEFIKEQQELNLKINNGQNVYGEKIPDWFFTEKIGVNEIRDGQRAYIYVESRNGLLLLTKMEIYK